jgi:group I intron endonuclease
MDIYSIYRITNTVNLKTYIGFTSQKPVLRWNAHRYTANKQTQHASVIHKAMKKYGVDQFVFEVIYQSKDRDHTFDVMEQYFINEYRAEYNVSTGGGIGKGVKNPKSDQWKLNHSKTMKGRKHTEEWKLEHASKMSGESNPMFGKVVATEALERAKITRDITWKTKQAMTCPHCMKQGTQNMTRYHFDNCRLKVSSDR